jgi:hypothetical protein
MTFPRAASSRGPARVLRSALAARYVLRPGP